MEPPKKISFSFSKSSKPLNIINSKFKEKNDVELIDCLEGQSIKIKNAIEEVKGPLIIPLRDNAKDLFDRVRQVKQVKMEEKPDSELTLDELAAQELLREAQQENITTSITKVHTLPVTADRAATENDTESTLDDYENVPVNDYGLAMLRGMGWSESTGIGKQNQQVTQTIEPELRPKGMGLGANKIVKLTKAPPVDTNGKELALIKGAFAKIIAGKDKGTYCEIIGLDDEAGRIIVKTALNHNTLSLNEFLLTPVTTEEYNKCSKIINMAKYEEYKARDSKNYKEEHSKSSSSDEETYNRVKGKKGKKSKYDASYSDSDDRRKRSHRVSNSRERSRNRSSSREHDKKSTTTLSKSKTSKKYSADSDTDNERDRKRNSSKSQKEDGDYKKKKSKKSKKHRRDRSSTDEDYKKEKKDHKSKKHRHRNRSNSSDEETYKKSKHKHKSSKSYR